MSIIHIINGPEGNLDFIGSYKILFQSSHRNIKGIFKICRSILLRLSPNNIRYFLDNTYLTTIKDSDIVILFDSITEDYVISHIEQLGYNLRKIFILWNPVKKRIVEERIAKLKRNGWEIWSFDPADCIKFQLKYCGQFMPVIPNETLHKANAKYDLYFVGLNKGRYDILDKLHSVLQNKLTLRFRKVSPIKALFNRKYSKRINYSTCLDEVSQSKCLLDLTQENQIGVTLRIMEAFFLKKKIITNNTNINKYLFYSPSYIFILKDDNYQDLVDFVNQDVSFSYTGFQEQYTYKAWLKRIINNVQMHDYNYD